MNGAIASTLTFFCEDQTNLCNAVRPQAINAQAVESVLAGQHAPKRAILGKWLHADGARVVFRSLPPQLLLLLEGLAIVIFVVDNSN